MVHPQVGRTAPSRAGDRLRGRTAKPMRRTLAPRRCRVSGSRDLAASQQLRRTGLPGYRRALVHTFGLDADAARRLRHAAAGDDRLPGFGGGGVLEAEAAAAHLFRSDGARDAARVVVEPARPLPVDVADRLYLVRLRAPENAHDQGLRGARAAESEGLRGHG